MTTSPDRYVRTGRVRSPGLALSMSMALDVALALEALAPGRVLARLVDLDAPGFQVRVNTVEIPVDEAGVLVSGTGWDVFRPVFVRALDLPFPGERAVFDQALGEVAALAMAAVLRAVRAPGSPGCTGP
jgi:hypothetical protein